DIQSSYHIFFFFSSRRRHTRSKRDWSSDVCSSDLLPTLASSRKSSSLDSSASKYCLGLSNGISLYISAVCASRKDLHITFKSLIVLHLPQHRLFEVGHT